MPRDEETLVDIANACRLVNDFVRGMDKTQFMKDAKTQSAVLHQLMVIGEAAKRLSQDIRNQHPEIPFHLIAGMRDKLIHEYDDVDLNEVWRTAEKDIPRLLSQLEPLLPLK